MRQKDQTKKAPTGTFQRDNLLAHLEKQAKEHPDKEDLVPFTGEKRGETLFLLRGGCFGAVLDSGGV